MHPLLAAVILTAAVTLTYLCCVRPNMRGRGYRPAGHTDEDRSAELEQLRAELETLRRSTAGQARDVDAGDLPHQPGRVLTGEADSR